MKLPVISLAILGVQVAAAHQSAGDLAGKVNFFQSLYTGIDFASSTFQPQRLLLGYGPWVAKRFIGAIAKPRMPIHGLPLSLS